MKKSYTEKQIAFALCQAESGTVGQQRKGHRRQLYLDSWNTVV